MFKFLKSLFTPYTPTKTEIEVRDEVKTVEAVAPPVVEQKPQPKPEPVKAAAPKAANSPKPKTGPKPKGKQAPKATRKKQ